MMSFHDDLWDLLEPQLKQPCDPTVAYALLDAVAHFYHVYGLHNHDSIGKLSGRMQGRVTQLLEEAGGDNVH